MIYDRGPLRICVPPAGFGAPFQGRLQPLQRSLYADLTLYHRRYWEAVQAGTRVDRMVQIPLGYDVQATSYAILDDGKLYRIEEAQYTRDEDGLPVTNLTLRRMEDSYELCKPESGS